MRVLVFVALLLLPPTVAMAQDPHAGHQPPRAPEPSSASERAQPQANSSDELPREPIPPVTEADRAAAFPQGLDGHATHERQINSFVLFDRLEWQGGGSGGLALDSHAWVGGDINRVWIRADAEAHDGDLERAGVDVLYGRAISRWWDLVAGVRQDIDPGPAQSWAAIGIQGLAPQWFEVEATLLVGADWRTRAHLEAEYELLFTQRLVLQPVFAMDINGKDDPAREVGAGLSSIEAALRLRYEIRREFAPYVGVAWARTFYDTAAYARVRGDEISNARLVFGVRTWF